jgi:hypothetical protein
MLVSEMIEIVSTRTTREDAFATAKAFAHKHPAFNFLMNLNAGKVVFPGMRQDTDFVLKAKDMTELGKNLGWFWKTKSAFTFLLTPSSAPGFNVQKKYDVLRRMANSIPYKEWIVFRTAMRGELIVADDETHGKVLSGVESDRFRGILQIMKEPEPVAEVIKITPVVTDNLMPEQKSVAEELIPPAASVIKDTEVQSEAPKKRGRPKGKKDNVLQ